VLCVTLTFLTKLAGLQIVNFY